MMGRVSVFRICFRVNWLSWTYVRKREIKKAVGWETPLSVSGRFSAVRCSHMEKMVDRGISYTEGVRNVVSL